MDGLAPTRTPVLEAGGELENAKSFRATRPKSVGEVARGFETMFLTLLLKEMRETLEPDTFFGGDKGDVLGGLFDQFMAEHLSQSGSLGIATMVRQQLERVTHTHERDRTQPRAAYEAGHRLANPAVP